MIEDFTERYRRVSEWATRAHARRWVDDEDIAGLKRIESESANDLFRDQNRRPLLVGLFGGTGVGKSSLLNRLAGHPVARVGIRRPTSTKATLYVHRSQTLKEFPVDSPVMDTAVEYHDVEDRRDVGWLDMPDIDSVEADNRELVLAWLPYIDWLIYVVSPERYRDDIGWQLIERRHRKHHWLFVINRWDEAADVQLDEFSADLEAAGFTNPVVLCTSCIQQDDDFERLESIINEAIRDHGLKELQRIGAQARLDELDAVCDSVLHRIGSEHEWEELQVQINAGIDSRLDRLKDRLGRELESVVQRYPPLPKIWRADPDPPSLPREALQKTIDAEFNTDLIADIGAEITIAVENSGKQSAPLGTVLDRVLAMAKQTVLSETTNSLNEAMAKPGGSVQSGLRRMAEFAAYALPLAAGIWAAYNLITGFQQGISGEKRFLGINFAVHSLLLIGLAWLIPFLLARWLRPSLRKTARRGLQAGLEQAADNIKSSLLHSFKVLMESKEKLLMEFPRS